MKMYVIMYRCIMYRCVHCVIESEHGCVNTCVYVGFGMYDSSCACIRDGEHICVCIHVSVYEHTCTHMSKCQYACAPVQCMSGLACEPVLCAYGHVSACSCVNGCALEHVYM